MAVKATVKRNWDKSTYLGIQHVPELRLLQARAFVLNSHALSSLDVVQGLFVLPKQAVKKTHDVVVAQVVKWRVQLREDPPHVVEFLLLLLCHPLLDPFGPVTVAVTAELGGDGCQILFAVLGLFVPPVDFFKIYLASIFLLWLLGLRPASRTHTVQHLNNIVIILIGLLIIDHVVEERTREIELTDLIAIDEWLLDLLDLIIIAFVVRSFRVEVVLAPW